MGGEQVRGDVPQDVTRGVSVLPQNIALRRSQCCADFPLVFSRLVLSTSALVAAALIASDPAAAQTAASSSDQPTTGEPTVTQSATNQRKSSANQRLGSGSIKRGKVNNPRPQAAPSAPNTEAGIPAPTPEQRCQMRCLESPPRHSTVSQVAPVGSICRWSRRRHRSTS